MEIHCLQTADTRISDSLTMVWSEIPTSAKTCDWESGEGHCAWLPTNRRDCEIEQSQVYRACISWHCDTETNACIESIDESPERVF